MSRSDHEDHEYHVVTMRFSRWDKEISSWWMPNLTCSPPQEVPRGLTVTFSLLPWGISRSHHEILLVTTRNLLVNQNFYLPPPKASLWSRREILFVTTRNLAVSPWDSFGHHQESFGECVTAELRSCWWRSFLTILPSAANLLLAGRAAVRP